MLDSEIYIAARKAMEKKRREQNRMETLSIHSSILEHISNDPTLGGDLKGFLTKVKTSNIKDLFNLFLDNCQGDDYDGGFTKGGAFVEAIIKREMLNRISKVKE